MSQDLKNSDDPVVKHIFDVIDNPDVKREDKQMLRALFQNLARHQAARIEELRSAVQSSISRFEHSKESFGDIVVALLPKDSDIRGFYPMYDFSQISHIEDDLYGVDVDKDFVGAFFRCDYDRFLEITDSGIPRDYDVTVELKNGQRIKTKCTFQINYAYLSEEKILQDAASQYDIETPLIYSPYSRRFAQVVFPQKEVSLSRIKSLEFGSPEDDIIATTVDHELKWNVEITNRKIPELDMTDAITSDLLNQKAAKYSDLFVANDYLIPGSTLTHKSKYACKPDEYLIFDGVGTRRMAMARDNKECKLYVFYDSNEKVELGVNTSIVILPKLNKLDSDTQTKLGRIRIAVALALAAAGVITLILAKFLIVINDPPPITIIQGLVMLLGFASIGQLVFCCLLGKIEK